MAHLPLAMQEHERAQVAVNKVMPSSRFIAAPHRRGLIGRQGTGVC